VVSGATSTLLGVAVVSWPTATTLVLAIATGGRLVVAGVGLVVEQRTPVQRAQPANGVSSRWRIAGSFAGLAFAAMLAVVSINVNRSQPGAPGAFYDVPQGELGPPGTLIRAEIVTPFLEGATARRILYVTTDSGGTPVTSSGLVIVPDAPVPESGRPMLAFTHGTIGIARRCAPSLLPGDTYAAALPGLDDFLSEGFAFVATDYAGLGSDATNGYLIGSDEAYSTLDSMRAARQIDAVGATADFVTFGESQGGHAALFTGELAAEYAPELRLRGVAAAAPATDLTALLARNVGTTFGNVLAAYAFSSWSAVHGLDLDDIIEAQARPIVDRLSEMCIQTESQMIALLPEAELLNVSFLKAAPWEVEPWATILAANTPGSGDIDAPVLIAQGGDDPLVVPDVQRSFVRSWCDRGQPIEYLVLDGVGHLDAGHASAQAVAGWAADRVAGVTWTSRCPDDE
jgi:pimeloyl-ACP methyl ester carboxylesterase